MKHFQEDDREYTYDEALKYAKKHGMVEEVRRDILHNDETPTNALKNTGIYDPEYDPEKFDTEDWYEPTIHHFQD